MDEPDLHSRLPTTGRIMTTPFSAVDDASVHDDQPVYVLRRDIEFLRDPDEPRPFSRQPVLPRGEIGAEREDGEQAPGLVICLLAARPGIGEFLVERPKTSLRPLMDLATSSPSLSFAAVKVDLISIAASSDSQGTRTGSPGTRNGVSLTR